MFLDSVGDTLGSLATGFAQGWNQSLGYQSRYGYQYNPYTGQYVPLPAVQQPMYYPYGYNTGSSMLPLLIVGGILLFALMKD